MIEGRGYKLECFQSYIASIRKLYLHNLAPNYNDKPQLFTLMHKEVVKLQ